MILGDEDAHLVEDLQVVEEGVAKGLREDDVDHDREALEVHEYNLQALRPLQRHDRQSVDEPPRDEENIEEQGWL